MKPDDARLARRVRSEINRRELNTQKLEVLVLHGVVHLGGEIGPTRSNRVTDWRKEFEIIEAAVSRLGGVRDVDNRMKWVYL